MNFGKLREGFVQNMPRKKNLLHFFHRCHGLREMSRILLPQENQRHLWSDLGKIKFSPSLVGKMTCLMGKMIIRHKDLFNELSWDQFGVEEGIQKLTATALFLEAASLGTFWPALGDLIFDRSNQLQIEKFHLGWKVDSNIFPTSYPEPDSGNGKALKQGCQCARPLRRCATTQRLSCSVKLQRARPLRRCATTQAVSAKITSNSLKISFKLANWVEVGSLQIVFLVDGGCGSSCLWLYLQECKERRHW